MQAKLLEQGQLKTARGFSFLTSEIRKYAVLRAAKSAPFQANAGMFICQGQCILIDSIVNMPEFAIS